MTIEESGNTIKDLLGALLMTPDGTAILLGCMENDDELMFKMKDGSIKTFMIDEVGFLDEA